MAFGDERDDAPTPKAPDDPTTNRSGGPGLETVRDPNALRRVAEELLRGRPISDSDLSRFDLAELVHELHVHQAELEVQNDELRRTQEQLERSRQDYVDLYNDAPVGYLTLDRDGMIRGANRTAARLLNADYQDLVDRPFFGFLADGGVRSFFEHVRTVIERRAGLATELELQRLSGERFWGRLQSIPVPNPRNAQEALQCRTALTDVTDLRQARESLESANEELRRSRDLLRHTFASLPEPVFVLDAELRVLDCSGAAHHTFGYHPSEITGRPFRNLFSGQRAWQEYRRRLQSAAEGRRPLYLTGFLMCRRDGSLFATDSASVSLHGGGGDRPSYLAVVRDVTERNRLEHLKTEFLASVSHELRTPLASVLGYIEAVLEAGEGLEAQERDFLTTAYESGLQLSGLVDDLLDVSRMDVGRFGLDFTRVRPDAVAESVLAEIWPSAEAKGVDLRAEIQAGLPEVLADRRRLGQVLRNLLGNAIKFTPRDGRVTLEMRMEDGRLEVAVFDTGLGIPEEDLPRLFGKFNQGGNSVSLAAGGTGLGLYISRTIIEGHGGAIEVWSRPGEGSRFSFWLPSEGK